MPQKTPCRKKAGLCLVEDLSAMQLKTDSSIAGIYAHRKGAPMELPLFASGISAGFPSPADDYIDRRLDLNQLLIKNPAATFFVRAAGDSMIGAGIHHDDILVVDRALEATKGKIVIAVVNGELTVKRLCEERGVCRLVAENPVYGTIEISEETGFEVWGVVTSVIHRF